MAIVNRNHSYKLLKYVPEKFMPLNNVIINTTE